MVLREDYRDRFAYCFLSGVAKKLLRADVPGLNDAVKVLGNNRFAGELNTRRKTSLRPLRLSLCSDVTKNESNDQHRTITLTDRSSTIVNGNFPSVSGDE